ncbi:MAG: O-antigen ligase family protein [Clostridiaceae bacterium]
MNHNDKSRSIQWLPYKEGQVFSWRFLAVLSLIGCVVTEILFNIMPIDHDTLLAYWFYPVSLVLLSQLYFSLRFTKHWEIRFLLAYLGWMCLTVVLNRSRAHLVAAYPWFTCICTVLFLCFSLPYAFDKKTAARVMTALAVATVLAVSFLSIVSLLSVYTKWFSVKLPSFSEGIFFDEGRLRIDNHPNRSAPAQALAIILVGYLLAQTKKSWQKVLWILLGILCFVPLALTVSRTGIIGAGIAIGFEVYLVLQEVLRKKTRAVLRVLIGVVAACISIVVIYKGAELVGRANNTYLARIEAVQVQQDALAVTPSAQPAESVQAPAPTAQPADTVSTANEVVDRDLSDADSFNGRTDIWLGVWKGLLQNPKILAFGTGPAAASEVMAPYFPVNSPIGLFHNSLVAVLVSFGVVGLLLTLVFLALVAVAAVKLSFGARYREASLAMRLLPAVLLFTFAEGMMEDFLFAYQALNVSWVWFMIAAGFVVYAVKPEPEAEQQELKA